MSRYIGFDFDNCIANAYSLTPLVILIELVLPAILAMDLSLKNETVILQKARLVFYSSLSEYESTRKGMLFRPSILQILKKLLEEKYNGNIRKLFIYSNNNTKEVIHIVDHILALTLQKAPYNVPESHLLKDTDGLLHVLSPRLHLTAECRANEPMDSNNFREKSLAGIQSCLGESFPESDLWYLDDTRYHTSLMNSLKDQYVVLEPYEVHLSNKDLAQLFVQSYPAEAFKPTTKMGSVFIKAINRILPKFDPTGTETRPRLVEKITKVLSVFSPESGGRIFKGWKDVHVETDYKWIEQNLVKVFTPVESNTTNTRPLTYTRTVGGGSKKGRSKKGRSKKSQSKRYQKTRKMKRKDYS